MLEDRRSSGYIKCPAVFLKRIFLKKKKMHTVPNQREKQRFEM